MIAPEMVAKFHSFGNSDSEVLGSNPTSGNGENPTEVVWNKRDFSSDEDSHHSFMTSSVMTQPNVTSPLCHNTKQQFPIENTNDAFGLNLSNNSNVQPSLVLSTFDSREVTSQGDFLQTESASVTKDICHGCNDVISDRYVHQISDRPYHEECLLCSECGVSLTSSCYVREGQLLCKEDYLRARKICSGCNLQIQDGEMVMRLMTSYDVYHVTCFKCSKCNFNLEKGDKYTVTSDYNDDATSKVTCQKCWQGHDDVTISNEIDCFPNVMSQPEDNEVQANVIITSELDSFPPVISNVSNMPSVSSNTTLSTSPSNYDVIDLIPSPRSQHSSVMSPKSDDIGELSDDDDDKEMTSLDTSSTKDDRDSREDGDNDKRPKRPRTILNAVQRRAFKAAFEMSPKPCRKVRETLASETGLTVRVVQVWFQNQRAKMKKLAKRQQSREHAMAMKAREQYGYHGFDPMTSLQLPMFPPPDVIIDPGYPQFPPQHPHEIWDRMHVSSPAFNPVASYPENIGFHHHRDPMTSSNDLQHSISPSRFNEYNSYSQSMISEQPANHIYPTNQQSTVIDVQPMRSEEMGTPIDGLYSMQNNYFPS